MGLGALGNLVTTDALSRGQSARNEAGNIMENKHFFGLGCLASTLFTGAM
jgi:hypothetical protein